MEEIHPNLYDTEQNSSYHNKSVTVVLLTPALV